MSELLRIASLIVIVLAYLLYFIYILLNSKNKSKEFNGFDISKEILSEYESINIVKSKNLFSVYNIKRKVIRLSERCYDGNDIASLSISLLEAGYSYLHNCKNNFINIIEKFIFSVKVLYILPIISLIINIVFYTISDSIIGIILISMFSFITFILIDTKISIYNWLCDELDNLKELEKQEKEKIMCFINNIIFLDKLLLIGQVIMLFRFIIILLGI